MWPACVRISAVVTLSALFMGCVKESVKPKLILASSLLPLAEDISASLHGNVDLSFLTSSVILKHMENGASCDGAILADETITKRLLHKNLVDPHIRVFANNALVLISAIPHAAKDIKSLLENLRKSEKIIIGDPDFVPLGAYTQEALKQLGVRNEHNRYIKAHSAQHASFLYKNKMAEWAILYESDARMHQGSFITRLDPSLHRAVRYEFVRCKTGRIKHREKLENVLFSKEFTKVLSKKGFQL